MSNLRTVTLELLRHGPAHNQLLSPLTQYLALCGNHSATTVTIPFEHNQLLVRLKALRYEESPDTRKLQLADTAQIMANVLGEVPGLIAELAETPSQDVPLTHLRLILSSSELALLPFELANAPLGIPGSGQPLALQAQAPVCITREVRRVSNSRFEWQHQPRILFAAASPPGVAPVPLEAHLLALRKVIDPWVKEDPQSFQAADSAETLRALLRKLEPHLVVLPQATVGMIREACAHTDFSHVHLLAHGLRMEGEEEKRYGLAMHSTDPKRMDIVDGARLAKLLRTYRDDGDNKFSGPKVVTIASCDSGQQGSVVGAGGSIAHALHEGGIPLVVASQFPLSVPASIIMADILYQGLLWGDDPRVLLNDLRWQLKARLPDTHDWASLVAYADLPPNLEVQLASMKFQRTRQSIQVVLQALDRLTPRVVEYFSGTGSGTVSAPKTGLPSDPGNPEPKGTVGPGAQPATNSLFGGAPGSYVTDASVIQEIERAQKKMTIPVERLQRLLRDTPAERAKDRSAIYGLLASTEKRDAKILFIASRNRGTGDGNGEWTDYSKLSSEAIFRARDYYELAFKEDRTSWALVQKLALDAVIEGPSAIKSHPWSVARVLSEDDLYLENRQRVAWAHASLCELYLLAMLNEKLVPRAKAMKRAEDHAIKLVKVVGGDSFEVYSHYRQIERYTDWFNEFMPAGGTGSAMQILARPASEILERLPRHFKFD